MKFSNSTPDKALATAWLRKSAMFLNQIQNMEAEIARMKERKVQQEIIDRKEAKKLAWAVAWDKKKNDTWKPKKWRKKGIGTVLREMNEEMLIEFDKAKDKDFQEGIDAAMKKA